MNKRLLLLLLLIAQVSWGDEEWIPYNENLRIPWANDSSYTRCEYDWWILNTGEPSDLYLNGIYQGSEYGTNSLRLDLAWLIHPQGVPVGVVDVNSSHGQRVSAVVAKVTRNQVFLSNSIRLYPEDIAAGISNFVALQFKVVVVTTGFNFAHEGLSNACRYAESKRALIFCAVPNLDVSIDLVPDYPSSWANSIASIVPITSTDRNGNLYGPGASAYGTNVTGAPGRNIISGDLNVYASGSSSATPIAAGCAAIMMQYSRGKTSDKYRNAIWVTRTPAMGIFRIDPVRMLQEF